MRWQAWSLECGARLRIAGLLRLVHMVPDRTQLGGVVVVVAHGCSLFASVGRIDDWLSILDCSSRLPYRLAIGVIGQASHPRLAFSIDGGKSYG